VFIASIQVDVEASGYKVLSTKVEIRLKKIGAVKWPTLEKSDQPHVPASGNYSDPSASGRPTYPTSNIRQVLAESFRLHCSVFCLAFEVGGYTETALLQVC
jgi:hypothetical protein